MRHLDRRELDETSEIAPRLSLESIAEAAEIIDPVFRDSPQFVSEPLSELVGAKVVLKVEIVNPIRSFKGRGTDYLLHRIEIPSAGLVCASAGNFGQGVAYAARKRGCQVTVFASVNASPMKVGRMKALGAEVVLAGDDFGAAKDHARERAATSGALFVEDGAVAAVSEGAGTIGLELCRMEDPLDALYVPLGDGALLGGVGTWMRQAWPSTRLVGVVAEGAPAMQLSLRAGHVVATESVNTIADGIAVREPIAEAFADVQGVVDEIVSVSDDQIVEAMRLLFRHAGLATEPAGAAGLAAAVRLRESIAGKRAGIIVTGGNASDEHLALLAG